MRRTHTEVDEVELLNDPLLHAIARATDPAARLPDRSPSMSAAQIRAWAHNEPDLRPALVRHWRWVALYRWCVLDRLAAVTSWEAWLGGKIRGMLPGSAWRRVDAGPRPWAACVVAVFVVVSGLVVVRANLGASGAPAQQQINAYLAAHPDGEQISTHEVSYSDGGYVIKFSDDVHGPEKPDCPSGSFCLYEHAGYGYPRMELKRCGWLDLAEVSWSYRIESVHYNLSTGSALFVGIDDRFSGDDTALFRVSASIRAIADVWPYRNRANRVLRTC